jgi:hypothetical protein
MRCFTLARRPDAERSGVPATVQLLEMAGPTVGGRTLKMVMSSAGVGWFWSTAPDGSLILLRVVNDAVVYEARITGVTASDVVATERACTGTP